MKFSENQKIKEEIMPRGGPRPGAGRHRKPTPPKPLMRRFDLAKRLYGMPGGSEGQRGRFVLAMAAYGAPEVEIAAALDIVQLSDSDREHMRTGRSVARANVLDEIWKKAERGNINCAHLARPKNETIHRRAYIGM
jgi:hypothetical protein